MNKLNQYKLKILSMSKLNYLFPSIFLLIMICNPNNNIIKSLIITFMLLLGIIILELFNLEFDEKLIFLLGFTLPFNILMIQGNMSEVINLAGSKNFFTFTFYDLLVIFTLIYMVYIKGIKDTICTNYKYLILPVIYLIINFATLFVAMNKMVTFYEILRVLKGILLFIVVGFYFTEKLYILFVRGIGLSMCAQFIIGVLQILKGKAIGLHFLGESHSVFRSGVEGLEKGMSGTMAHPGTLAIYSVFVLSIMIFINRELIREKYIFLIVTIFTIILTFSRTSMLLMFGVVGCALLFYVLNNSDKRLGKFFSNIKSIRLNRKTISIALIVGVVIISATFLFKGQITAVINRFTSSDMELQANSRTWHARIGINVYKEREHFAYGANNYTYVIREKYPKEYAAKRFHYIQPVHNLYVLYLVEIGLIGVVTYIVLYGKLILDILRIKFIRGKVNRAIIMSTGVWALAIMLYNLTGWSAAKDYFIQIMWIVIGLNMSANLSNKGVE